MMNWLFYSCTGSVIDSVIMTYVETIVVEELIQ